LIAPGAAQLGPTNTAGTRLGMMFFIMSFGGVSVFLCSRKLPLTDPFFFLSLLSPPQLLGTPISGYILGSEAPYKWWATAGYSAACVTVGVVLHVFARQIAVKNNLHGKI
jgi:MCP family monocarboxylic acid transporter-like MFS transporter 10